MTIIDLIKQKKEIRFLKKVAKYEEISEERLKDLIKKGRVVLPYNKKGYVKEYRAIGEGLRIKVNANIGTSRKDCSLKKELKKLDAAVKAGADAVMDLSTGGNLDYIRKKIRENCLLPLGTVPIYQSYVKAGEKNIDLKAKNLIADIETQAKTGIDFMTIHCGLIYKSIKILDRTKRILPVVSRGGALILDWMRKRKTENPYYRYFDEILDIAKEYDITLSLGDACRPGTTLDADDDFQNYELEILGELTRRCRKKNVQVMIEGPGHMSYDKIKENIKKQKKLCLKAPYYVLGPLPIDFAPGYDHIVGAIGGAFAAYNNVDFLCYLTPAEHLRLPDTDDVYEGVLITKIAGYIADRAKGKKYVLKRDKAISEARADLDWAKQFANSINPELAEKKYKEGNADDKKTCSMCDSLCSIKISKRK